MKKKSVFIVDSSVKYVNDLSKELSKEEDLFVVGWAVDGIDALEKMKVYSEIDVLIIHMIISGKDGFQVLKELKVNSNQYPKINLILCQSPIANDHIISLIGNLGGDHFFQKPTSYQTILEHIKSFESVTKKDDIKLDILTVNKRITRVLHNLGIPAHIKGYNYIRESIELTIDNPSIIGQVTKLLYPQIAEKYDSSTTKVERAIRHAIELGWSRGSQEVIDEIFGYTISASKAKPTNSEFIAMLGDYISIKVKNANKTECVNV
jgi:two-component system response regulator (stage 0 sporulation protein A)